MAKKEKASKKKPEAPSEENVASKLKAIAAKTHKAAVQWGAMFKRRWPDLGKICLDMSEKNLFKYLMPPFLDFTTWTYAAEIGRSTAYDVLKCYRALKHLPHKELLKINMANAKHFATVPLDLRKDPDWIKKAQTMKEGDFQTMCEKVVAKKKKDKDPAPDAMVPFIVKMLQSQKDFINECVEELRNVEGTDVTPGRALELICAEWRSGFDQEKALMLNKIVSLMPAVFNALVTQGKILTSDKSADEQLTALAVVQGKAVDEVREFVTLFGQQLDLIEEEDEAQKPTKKKGKKKAGGKATEFDPGKLGAASQAAAESAPAQ